MRRPGLAEAAGCHVWGQWRSCRGRAFLHVRIPRSVQPALLSSSLHHQLGSFVCPLPAWRQVMALIAYLMEKKQNFGPHLIIVPNAGGWVDGWVAGWLAQ